MSHTVNLGRLTALQGQTRQEIKTIKLVGNANKVNDWICWGPAGDGIEWCFEPFAAPAPQDIKAKALAAIPHNRQLI